MKQSQIYQKKEEQITIGMGDCSGSENRVRQHRRSIEGERRPPIFRIAIFIHMGDSAHRSVNLCCTKEMEFIIFQTFSANFSVTPSLILFAQCLSLPFTQAEMEQDVSLLFEMEIKRGWKVRMHFSQRKETAHH